MVDVGSVRLELDLGEEGAKKLAAAAARAGEKHRFKGTGWKVGDWKGTWKRESGVRLRGAEKD